MLIHSPFTLQQLDDTFIRFSGIIPLSASLSEKAWFISRDRSLHLDRQIITAARQKQRDLLSAAIPFPRPGSICIR